MFCASSWIITDVKCILDRLYITYVGQGSWTWPSLDPVSYTHLDVYKRQVCGSAHTQLLNHAPSDALTKNSRWPECKKIFVSTRSPGNTAKTVLTINDVSRAKAKIVLWYMEYNFNIPYIEWLPNSKGAMSDESIMAVKHWFPPESKKYLLHYGWRYTVVRLSLIHI